MLLKNKKTGEIGWLYCDHISIPKKMTVFAEGKDLSANHWDYNSLAELNEEWEDAPEDCKRKDPLISFGDERRLVRHWATVYNIKEVWVGAIGNGSFHVVLYDTTNGKFRISINRPLAVEVERAYTIKQLCGEEEK